LSLHEDLAASPDVATAFAAALAQQLGEDTTFTVGPPTTSLRDALPNDAQRAISLTFAVGDHDAVDDDGAATEDGGEGTILFVPSDTLAQRLERTAPDELVLTAAAPALNAAATAIGAMTSLPVEADTPEQADLQAISDIDRDVVIYAILEDELAVGWLIMYAGIATNAEAPEAVLAPVTSAPPAPNGANVAPQVLADVEMGVTAELGRCHMSIREVLSLTPGAVIDLDRAAGAPVDVLVNGTVIARGEVVVIDEEFGIRISEILGAA
jgi:flagellar motor switch protein FliN/FliY